MKIAVKYTLIISNVVASRRSKRQCSLHRKTLLALVTAAVSNE